MCAQAETDVSSSVFEDAFLIYCPLVFSLFPLLPLSSFFSLRPLSLFHQGPRVKEGQLQLEALQDPEGLTSDLNVTALCHPFILNLTQQYEWRQNRGGRINEGACPERRGEVHLSFHSPKTILCLGMEALDMKRRYSVFYLAVMKSCVSQRNQTTRR